MSAAPPDSSPPPSISVLMPTWQGAEFLDRVLTSLAAQRTPRRWDFLAIDSGSTDGTLEILERHREGFPVPLRVRSIHQVEFDHGDTRNLLAALSEGALLVFLTQDAIPVGEDWLEALARNFDDPAVGAATCRNVPRPDARPLTKIFSADDPGYAAGRRETRLPPRAEYDALSPHEKRLLYNFNDVASAVRRSIWERHPFPRTWFGEDVLQARALLEDGWTVVYDDAATVEHSHDYDADETYARAKIDGRFNVEWLDRVCVGSLADARTLGKRFAETDAAAIRAAGFDGEEARALEEEARGLRDAAFRGLHDGGLSDARYPSTRVLPDGRLKILYTVHGFPPDTWAGTEVYTLNLAREMQRRGHEVVILARSPGRDGVPDFSVEEDAFEDLRVLRFVHRLDHASLRESYHKPEAEDAFREVLAREQPDLVHFQHLIHMSAGLVQVARDLGLPTVLTCHDYWSLCARVQLIRPDGERCDRNMGAGCLLCVKEQKLEHVPRFERLGRMGGPLLDAVASGARRLGTERSRRRWEGWADLRDRHRFVTEAYAKADLRISPSRFLRTKLLESGAFDAHTFLYSDNGMRTDHVEALAKRPDPDGVVRFGFVGSLVWYKGGETMVRAMQRLRDAPARLAIYGDFRPDEDPHHRELRELAGDNVEFRGRFDNARLSEVYAEIDVLVVPSTWFENSPITIHEAFLTETPVLASNIGGMAEYVRDGVDGLLFEVGDDASLAAAMRRFVDEPDLLERLSRDWMTIKTIAENAAETEFRYRGLCAQVRERDDVVLLDCAGAETEARAGAAEVQGADLLLLRPGGSAAEYALPSGDGELEVRVDVFALGGESAVELGGRVLLDGVALGPLEPFTAGDSDETRTFRVRAPAPNGTPRAGRLRVESSLDDGRELHLRIARVVVRALGQGGFV